MPDLLILISTLIGCTPPVLTSTSAHWSRRPGYRGFGSSHNDDRSGTFCNLRGATPSVLRHPLSITVHPCLGP
jgi:hypothetical protein